MPYWSTCYEGWYYVMFGLIMFLPRRTGIAAVIALTFALGPKVALLAPLWWLGVLLYRWPLLKTLPTSTAWFMVVASAIGIAAFHSVGVAEAWTHWFKGTVGQKWFDSLTFSKFFAADYVLGLLVFMNFAGMRKVATSLAPLFDRLERPVRYAARYTFTLYLLHQPLFLFWGAVTGGDPGKPWYWWQTTLLVALSVLAVGHLTQSKRHLLKRWIAGQLDRWQPAAPTRVAI